MSEDKEQLSLFSSEESSVKKNPKKRKKTSKKKKILKTETKEISSAKKPEVSPQEEKNTIQTVSELNQKIRSQLEGSFSGVIVQGEISNFKKQLPSGHFYFSLKDENSQISCVMFRSMNEKLKFVPEDGLEVVIKANVTVYEKRGNYQLMCFSISPVGEGALRLAFEQLKEKLEKKSYFDIKHKKDLPTFPNHIGIVTSATGAALRDMLHVLNRRFPLAKVTISPCLVQGDKAYLDIIKALEAIEKLKVDVILLGRGGGSLEDLWAFNEEKLVEAIFHCKTPVISCVGHETDYSLTDFVADKRAPTPSAAAEMAVPDIQTLISQVTKNQSQLFYSMKDILKVRGERLNYVKKTLKDPKKKIFDFYQRIDENLQKISVQMKIKLSDNKNRFNQTQKILQLSQAQLNKKQEKFRHLSLLLDSLSPLKVLQRGYSIVEKKGKMVKDISQVKASDSVSVTLSKGKFEAQVKKIITKEKSK